MHLLPIRRMGHVLGGLPVRHVSLPFPRKHLAHYWPAQLLTSPLPGLGTTGWL
jgi:hypothetical protein